MNWNTLSDGSSDGGVGLLRTKPWMKRSMKPALPAVAVAQPETPPAPVSIAVIFPLHDDRGMGLTTVEAWQRQQHDDPDCHLVVVGPQRGPLSAAIRQRLCSQDRFVENSSRNEAVLYNAGGQATSADWLLFTESHVLPTANTLAAFRRELANSRADAAVLGSTHRARSRFSAVDAALHEQESDSMQALGLWRCVGLRGFAIRRSVFEALGCFNARYFRFAETALAIHLVDQGYQLESFPNATVCHVDSDSLGEIFSAMKYGRLGACRFHEEEPFLAQQAFGCPVSMMQPRASDLRMARWLWRQALQALRAGHLRAAGRLSRFALPETVLAVGGCGVARLRAFLRNTLTLLHFVIMLHGTRRHRPATDPVLLTQYALLRQRCADLGSMQHQHERNACRLPPEPRGLSAVRATDCATHGLGFFGPELWRGETYCWSAPQAGIRLFLPPGQQVIRLDTRPTGQWAPRRPRFFVNGDEVPQAACQEQDGIVTIAVGQITPLGGDVLLSWNCRSFRPARAGLLDRRRLGVALVSATVHSAFSACQLDHNRRAA